MNNIIGYRIKCLREEQGWLQQELADKLRIECNLKTSRGSVNRWENGKAYPEVWAIKCLASLFGVTMDYIIGNSDSRTPEPTEDTIREELRSNPKLRMLLSASSKLSQSDMDRLIAIAEVLNRESVQ